MPTNTSDQQIPLPVDADPADAPVFSAAMTAVIEPRLVLRYTNLADRTARNPSPAAGEISFLTSENLHYRFDNSASRWFELYPIIRQKLADQNVNNSAVLVNDTHLFFPMNASASYILDGWLMCDGPAAADIQLTFTGPAGFGGTMFNIMAADTTVAATNTTLQIGSANTIANIHQRGTLAVGTFLAYSISGQVFTGVTAGNLQLRWAQVVATVGNTRITAGSWMRLMRVG